MLVTGPGASNGARCTSPFPVTSLDPPTAGLSLLFLSCALGLGCRGQGSQGLVAFEQERHAFGVGGEFWGFSAGGLFGGRSEEHTYELQSLMRHSSAVFSLKRTK